MTVLLKDKLRLELERAEEAERGTSAGKVALERFRQCEPGKHPHLCSRWSSGMLKMIRAGLEHTGLASQASEADTANRVGGSMVTASTALDLKLTQLKDKMSLPGDGVLSVREEPIPGGGTKGYGIYYDGTRPLARRLGNYRDHGARVISRMSWRKMTDDESKYVLTLNTCTEDLCDRWKSYGETHRISQERLREELEHKKQLVVDANPDHACNFLALLNEPSGSEEVNVEVRGNGDFHFVGTQYKAGYLLFKYDLRRS